MNRISCSQKNGIMHHYSVCNFTITGMGLRISHSVTIMHHQCCVLPPIPGHYLCTLIMQFGIVLF